MGQELIYHKTVRIPFVISLTFALGLIALSIYSGAKGRSDYFVFFCLLLIPFFFLTFIDIQVTKETVLIQKFFILGIIRKKYLLTTKNILTMTGHVDKLEVDESYLYEPPNDSIWPLLLSKGYVKTNVTDFRYLDASNIEQVLSLKLMERDYRVIWKTLNGGMHAH